MLWVDCLRHDWLSGVWREVGLDALGFIFLVGFFLLYIYVLGGDYFCFWVLIF